jgi:hypothetical protein
MTRRLLFTSLFVGFALSSTGCCGVIRNFVHRVRANHHCYPAFGGPCCDAGPAYSPSYSIGAPGLPDPGCAGCGAANVPMGGVPGYAGAVPVVPPNGTTAIFPGMGAKMAGGK